MLDFKGWCRYQEKVPDESQMSEPMDDERTIIGTTLEMDDDEEEGIQTGRPVQKCTPEVVSDYLKRILSQ